MRSPVSITIPRPGHSPTQTKRNLSLRQLPTQINRMLKQLNQHQPQNQLLWAFSSGFSNLWLRVAGVFFLVLGD